MVLSSSRFGGTFNQHTRKMGVAKVFFAIIAVLFAILVYFILKPQTFEPIKPLEEKWWGEGSRQDESAGIIPFKVEFSESRNSDLLARLRNTRYFESLENAGWRYGTRPDFMKIVVDYWVNKFSWRNQVGWFKGSQGLGSSFFGLSDIPFLAIYLRMADLL